MEKVICKFKPINKDTFVVSSEEIQDLMDFLLKNRVKFTVSSDAENIIVMLTHASVEIYCNTEKPNYVLYIMRIYSKGDLEALRIATQYHLNQKIYQLLDEGATPEEALREYDLL